MKFGLFGGATAHNNGRVSDSQHYKSFIDYVVEAEELGFHSVWVSDHFVYALARYGGDEMVVILPQAGAAEVIAFGERLLTVKHPEAGLPAALARGSHRADLVLPGHNDTAVAVIEISRLGNETFGHSHILQQRIRPLGEKGA